LLEWPFEVRVKLLIFALLNILANNMQHTDSKKKRFVITGFDCTQLIFGSIAIEDGVNKTTRYPTLNPSTFCNQYTRIYAFFVASRQDD